MSYPADIIPIATLTPPKFQGVGNSVYQPFTSNRHIQTPGVNDQISIQVDDIPSDGDTLTISQGSVSFVYTLQAVTADPYDRMEIDIVGLSNLTQIRDAIYRALAADFQITKYFSVAKSGSVTLDLTNEPSGEFIGSTATVSNPLSLTAVVVPGTEQVARSNYALFMQPIIEELYRGSEQYLGLPRLVLPFGFSTKYVFELAKSFLPYFYFDSLDISSLNVLLLGGPVRKYRIQIGEIYGDGSISDKTFNDWGGTVSELDYTENYSDLIYPFLFAVNAKTDEYATLIRNYKYSACAEGEEIPDTLLPWFDASGTVRLLTENEKDSKVGNVDYLTFWNGHRNLTDLTFVVVQTLRDGSSQTTEIPFSTLNIDGFCTSAYHQVISIPGRLLWDNQAFDLSQTKKVCVKVMGGNYHEAEPISVLREFLRIAETNYPTENFSVGYIENGWGFFDFVEANNSGLTTTLGGDLFNMDTERYTYTIQPSAAHAGGTRFYMQAVSKDTSYNSYVATIFTLDGLTFYLQLCQKTGVATSLPSTWNGSELVCGTGYSELDLGPPVDVTEYLTVHLDNPNDCDFVTFLYQNQFGVPDTLHLFRSKETVAKSERLNFSPTLNRWKSDYNAKLSDRKDATFDANYGYEYSTVVIEPKPYTVRQMLSMAISNAVYEVQNHRGTITETACAECDSPCSEQAEPEETLMPVLVNGKSLLIQSGSGKTNEVSLTWADARDTPRKLAV